MIGRRQSAKKFGRTNYLDGACVLQFDLRCWKSLRCGFHDSHEWIMKPFDWTKRRGQTDTTVLIAGPKRFLEGSPDISASTLGSGVDTTYRNR